MRFGFHLSISGGLPAVVDAAERIGCRAVQFFVRNPRQWKSRRFDDKEVEMFLRRRREAGLGPVVVHLSYLPNLAGPDTEIRRKSLQALLEEWRITLRIGADYLVVHPGHHHGSGLDRAHERVAEALAGILTQEPVREDGRPRILLENAAGQGTEVGADLGELRRIRAFLGPLAAHVGYCVDTAHAVAAGYRFRTRWELDRFVDILDSVLGLDRVALWHLNDSRVPVGKRVDRHWHVGCGAIGRDAFRRLVRHPRLESIPAIMETPKKREQDDVENLARVLSL
jgi:deoxyribonuclease-4